MTPRSYGQLWVHLVQELDVGTVIRTFVKQMKNKIDEHHRQIQEEKIKHLDSIQWSISENIYHKLLLSMF